MKYIILAAALVLATQLASATGLYTCEAVAKDKWMSKEDLTKQLEGEGWTVRFMKEDGGCCEVYGSMPDGKRVEGYFHPASGATQLISQRVNILFRADSSSRLGHVLA